MRVLTQSIPPAAFVLSEANGQRSRENWLVSLGKKLKAGEVAKIEDAVDLTTTANTHNNTTLDTIAATTGLMVGDVYTVTGTAIPANTTFTFNGSSAGTLSHAATATGAGVTVHITKPSGLGPWLVLGDRPAGVALYDADATDGEIMASFIARDAEVNLKMLIFPGFDGDDLAPIGDVISDLAGIGIICRD